MTWKHAMVQLAGVGLLASMASTQFLAHQAGFDPALGEPWITWQGTPVYNPLSCWSWQAQWGDLGSKNFLYAHLIFWGVLFGWFVLFALAADKRRLLKPTGAYGSAQWADEQELRKAGMLADHGIVLGQTAEARFTSKGEGKHLRWSQRVPGKLISHDGPEHALVSMPTRAGKGISVIIPTLLTWRHSGIFYDIKRELYNKTGGWRALVSRCICFEPTSEVSPCWNVVMEVRPHIDVADAQRIAEIVVSVGEDYWRVAATDLTAAGILHVLYAEEDKSLPGVLKLFTDPNRPLLKTLEVMARGQYTSEAAQLLINGTARAMLDRGAKERSGVLNTALASLALYRDPRVARAVSGHDFSIRDLVDGDKPVSLYLVMGEPRLRPLVRLFFSFAMSRLTESLESGSSERRSGWKKFRKGLFRWWNGTPTPKKAGRHPLLLLIDELPTLKKMEALADALPVMAGYGIRALLVVQSFNQLKEEYGNNNAILDGCHIRVVSATNDEETAARVSKAVGTASMMRIGRSRSRQGTGGSGRGSRSESYQEFGRPLLTPDEVQTLDFTKSVILRGGGNPYLAKKNMYYLDSWFEEMSQLPAPESAEDRAEQLPPQTEGCPWLAYDPAVWAAANKQPEESQADVAAAAQASEASAGAAPQPIEHPPMDDQPLAGAPSPIAEGSLRSIT